MFALLTALAQSVLAAERRAPGLAEISELLRAGKYRGARSVILPLLAKNPNDVFLRFNLANSYLLEADFLRAAEVFGQVARGRDSPLRGFAYYYGAKALSELGKLGPALEWLSRARQSHPPENLLPAIEEEAERLGSEILNKASEHYRAGRDEAVLEDTDVLQRLKPSAEEKLLRAYSLIRLGRADEGRLLLTELTVADSTALAGLKARALLGQMDAQTSDPTPWQVWVDLQAGRNSNVFASAVDDLGLTAAPERRGFSAVDVGFRGGRRIHILVPSAVEAEMRWEEVWGLPMERSLAARIRPEWSLLPPTLKWTSTLEPEIRYEAMGGKANFLRPNLSLRMGRVWEKTDLTGLLNYTRNRALDPAQQSLDGFSVSAFFFLGWRTFWAIDARAQGGVILEKNREIRAPGALLPTSYRGLVLGFGLERDLSTRVHLAISPSWTWKLFDERTIPDSLRRYDLTVVLPGRIECRVFQGFALYANVAALINQSTLGPGTVLNKNYDQVKLAIGASWEPVL